MMMLQFSWKVVFDGKLLTYDGKTWKKLYFVLVVFIVFQGSAGDHGHVA